MKRLISVILCIIMVFSLSITAFASEIDSGKNDVQENIVLEVGITEENPGLEKLNDAKEEMSIVSADEFVQSYFKSTGTMPRANETYVYETGKMSTGTWGIKWSAKVTFVLGQRTNGEYYYKTINSGSVTLHKNYLILALYGTVFTSTSERYHSIINNGKTIRISMVLNVEIWPADALLPLTSSEKLYVDIPITNVTP